MKKISPVLDWDETVYAASAYNCHAFQHTAHNASKLTRDDSFPSYGWMAKRAFLEEVLPLWQEANSVSSHIDYKKMLEVMNRNLKTIKLDQHSYIPLRPGVLLSVNMWDITQNRLLTSTDS